MFIRLFKHLPHLNSKCLSTKTFFVLVCLLVTTTFLIQTNILLNKEKNKYNLTRERLSQVSTELSFASKQIVENLNFDFIRSCSEEIKYLTETDLGLSVDTQTKEVSLDSLYSSIGIGPNSEILLVSGDPTYFSADGHFWQEFEYNFTKKQITVTAREPQENQRARTLQVVVIISDQYGTFCKQAIRLFFSPALSLPGNWKVHSVLGRGGMGDGGFSLPYGTEFYEGQLWTTDCSNENISVFSLDGHFKGSFSGFGTEIGKLDTPADMKIFNRKMYVVEELNHRVQVFELDGTPIRAFGSFGEVKSNELGTDKFNNPLGISVTDNDIVIVDFKNDRIIAYDHDFKFKWSTGNEYGDPFEWQGAYYIDYSMKNQHFLVSNQSFSEIGIVDKNGRKIKSFGNEILGTPFELAVTNSGDLLVADTTKFQAVLFDGQKDYNVKQVFPFPEYFGIPKTITSINDSMFAIGFVGNGQAYFLVLKNEPDNSNFATIEPNPGAQKIHFSSNRLKKIKSDKIDLIYRNHCASCHENGKYGAPARGNVEAWEIFPRDRKLMLENLMSGKGAMLKNGGCVECNKTELLELIDVVLPQNW